MKFSTPEILDILDSLEVLDSFGIMDILEILHTLEILKGFEILDSSDFLASFGNYRLLQYISAGLCTVNFYFFYIYLRLPCYFRQF